MSAPNNPRYTLGIDLGTTNCVLAYMDLKNPRRGPRILPLPQWESAERFADHDLLPSFLCALPPGEKETGFRAEKGPVGGSYPGWVAGVYARNQLALRPGRVVSSAKSWLCHPEIDRCAAILPWKSEDIPAEQRLSPIQVSSAYLAYFRESWDRLMAGDDPNASFARQDVVITVPASFDEVAQQLTLEAAKLAGYPPSLRLIEEPQAAFYAWLDKSSNLTLLADLLAALPEKVARVLVCDIGGGTTDLSLFEVRGDTASANGLGLKRLAVSDHILLGGDNIDLTLAYLLEGKLTGGRSKLSGRQWNQLLAQARDLKERLLNDQPEQQPEFTVTLAGSGSGLFASTLSTTIAASEVRDCILEGFFPACGAADRPRKKTTGLREWGLPFADDSAITRHLAAFLDQQPIDAVLYNGGSVTPQFLRNRLTALLTDWQDGYAPTVLSSDSLAMAVARGAAKYGYLLRQPQGGERITGGHAHALYIEVKQK
ncbi:MAG: Hsp70 family protein [Desulfuromonadaceae bacterium]